MSSVLAAAASSDAITWPQVAALAVLLLGMALVFWVIGRWF